MRISTNTTLTPTGKVKVQTTTRISPMLPPIRTSSTFSLIPPAPARKKNRLKKKKR